MRPVIVALVSLSFASLVACSSSTEGSGEGGPNAGNGASASSASAAAADTGSFCDAFCQKMADCDRGQDAQTCSAKCDKSLGSLDKFRADVVTGIKTCWQASDCKQVLSDDRIGGCFDEAAVNTTPSAAAKELCDALVSNLSKCDGSINYAKCLSSMKLYNDQILGEAKTCTSKSCANILSCVDATLDF